MFVTRKWSRRIVLSAAILCVRPGFGAPALTTIQDILYKADGTRFNGSIFIAWNNFQSGDSSTIPIQGLTVPVVNGVFKIQLVPTTDASPGANYSIKYSSQGKFQFSESWAVPPSSVALKVRDVRISSGSVVGGTPPSTLTSQILITDVTGLSNELSLRPLKGAGFVPARAAVVNSSGQLDAATGNAADCVRVDGSSGPCGSGGGSTTTLNSDSEVPSGIADGNNTIFTLQFPPSPTASLTLYRNGVLMRQGIDYSLAASSITFATASVPQAGDLLTAFYRYGSSTNPLASFTFPQVVCSGVGQSTSAATPAILGSCTLPAGLLNQGDRIEILYDFTHQGSTTPFTSSVTWGGSTIIARGGAATDSTLSGRSSAAIYSAGARWNTESWGATIAYLVTSGSAPDTTTAAIPIHFLGQMASSTSDSIAVTNFTVIRYPAQTNP
jgi:hypothetical protein